jgi:hypothetical protein
MTPENKDNLEKANTIITPKEFIMEHPNAKRLTNKMENKKIDMTKELKKIGIINKSKKNNILDVKLANDKKKRRIKNKTSRKARKLNYKRSK